jgi:hypothetical protein
MQLPVQRVAPSDRIEVDWPMFGKARLLGSLSYVSYQDLIVQELAWAIRQPKACGAHDELCQVDDLALACRRSSIWLLNCSNPGFPHTPQIPF